MNHISLSMFMNLSLYNACNTIRYQLILPNASAIVNKTDKYMSILTQTTLYRKYHRVL